MMTILLKWFREKDKLQHILAGAVIFMLFSIEFRWVWAWLAVVVAALGREMYGYHFSKKRFSLEDIGATLLGGGGFCFLLFLHYQNNL
jgi:hypothetical protein